MKALVVCLALLFYDDASAVQVKTISYADKQWHGKHDIRVEEHEIPDITDPEDALVRVTCATVCGSDLHLYNGEVSMFHATSYRSGAPIDGHRLSS